MFLVLFGGAVFLLSQALVVPTFGEDARTRRLLKRRLREIGAVDAGTGVTSLLRQKYLRELPPLARRLESLPLMERLAALHRAGGPDDAGAPSGGR